ncbi:MAG: hypothetical protein JRI52_01560 [Deltaproteobacteria bacterium]|nr:hypothetical protein [Deltaproteobacteria bacterium]
MAVESEELIELMEKVEAKGLDWDKVGEQIKVKHDILKLYANSGPVPVTIINNLKKMLEEGAQ